MKLYCCLCGRPMDKAAVVIGQMPVGAKCARRAGLLGLAKRKLGAVRLFAGVHTRAREQGPKTMDLFEEEA